jgi:hypothetical protein
MKQKLRYTTLLLLGALTVSPWAQAAPDWSKVAGTTVHVFHPGATPWEWIESKGKHGGSRGLARGESCAGCHVEGGEINVDLSRLGSELEPKGAPRTMSFPVTVQAAYDAGQLYVRLSFKAPEGGFDKSDKDNAVKATLLFPNAQVPMAEQVGCWASCHQDARTMPDGKDRTKYVSAGAYELVQWSSSGKVADGSISDQRRMDGGQAGAKAEGGKNGDTWTVTFSRKLPATPTVHFGLAVHADHAGGRFHHVSFGHTIGLGGDGDVKAQKF